MSRRALVDVRVSIEDGQLRVAWLFSDRALPTGRVEEQARAHEAALRLTDDAPGTDRPAAGPGADALVND
jgi:hypothetical protein